MTDVYKRQGQARAFDADKVDKTAHALCLFNDKITVAALFRRCALRPVAGKVADKVAHLDIGEQLLPLSSQVFENGSRHLIIFRSPFGDIIGAGADQDVACLLYTSRCV